MSDTATPYQQTIRQQRLYYVLALFGVVCVHLFLIVRLPGYITDDYYIFHLVSRDSSSWYVDNPQEKFYLFYRPISYVYFYILYHTVGNNPLAMKGIAVGVLFFTLLLIAGIVARLSRYFSKDISTSGMMLMLAFVAFHPDVLQSVLWIANINELLMSMLYLLSLYAICGILVEESGVKSAKIVIAILAFAGSVLAKQQSLHLPILLIAFLVWQGKTLALEKRRALWIIVAVTFVLMLVMLSLNAELFAERGGTEKLVESLWKKPFALAGSLMYILFPLYGLDIYALFLVNKIYAVGAAVVGVGVLVVAIRKNLLSLRSIISGILFLTIIFFPRLFLATSDRINVLQVVVIAIVAAFVVGRSKTMLSVFAVLVLLTMAGGMKSFLNFQQRVKTFDKMNRELFSFVQQKENTVYVMAYFEPFFPTSSSLFFLKHGSFGIDTSLQRSGIVVRNNFSGLVTSPPAHISVFFDSIRVEIKDPVASIYVDKDEKQPKILNATTGIRGFTSLSFRLNENIERKEHTLITYSDSGWVALNVLHR